MQNNMGLTKQQKKVMRKSLQKIKETKLKFQKLVDSLLENKKQILDELMNIEDMTDVMRDALTVE